MREKDEVIKMIPVDVYSISKDWLTNMMSQIKETIMQEALEKDCPKPFLVNLNALHLQFGDQKPVSVAFDISKKMDTSAHQSTVTSAPDAPMSDAESVEKPQEAAPEESSEEKPAEENAAAAEEAPAQEAAQA